MEWTKPVVYAVKHKDENVRAASRSGGIFTALSDSILQAGGVVYGCVLTEDFKAVHVRADNAVIRNQMRGSKYIQSDLGDSFVRVRQDLENGKKVLFSGTSCQVAGLKRFLGTENENLFCLDIVCHGVPSATVWEAYLEWQSKRAGKIVASVDFRNKGAHGWTAHKDTVYFSDGTSVDDEVFTELFYGHYMLRPSCYECPYKSILHPGDITIGDYWGIEKAAADLDDDKGVSLVLVNNDKGNTLFDGVKDELEYRCTRLEDSMQPPLKAPFPRPQNRERFWKDYATKPFHYIALHYGGYGVWNWIRKKGGMVKRRLFQMLGIRK